MFLQKCEKDCHGLKQFNIFKEGHRTMPAFPLSSVPCQILGLSIIDNLSVNDDEGIKLIERFCEEDYSRRI